MYLVGTDYLVRMNAPPGKINYVIDNVPIFTMVNTISESSF